MTTEVARPYNLIEDTRTTLGGELASLALLHGLDRSVIMQPAEFKGEYDTPIVVVHPGKTKPQVLWADTKTFVSDFGGKNIGQIVDNPGSFQRLATPDEAKLVYDKVPHMSKDHPTYLADKDGVYLSTQSYIEAENLNPQYVISEPSITKIDPETNDLQRVNPSHRVLFIGIPSK